MSGPVTAYGWTIAQFAVETGHSRAFIRSLFDQASIEAGLGEGTALKRLAQLRVKAVAEALEFYGEATP